jgi:hypothetical protein
MPRYDVRTAALALDVPYAWLDVTLARYPVAGVSKSGPGASRSVTEEAVATLRLARDFTEHLKVPIAEAIQVAEALLASPTGTVGRGALRLGVDRERLAGDLRQRLEDATWRAVPRRRGRPPARDRDE